MRSADGAAAPICTQGCDRLRPETKEPFRPWPASTPPPLSTCPLSAYVVVLPATVMCTPGTAPEFAHEAMLPPL